MARKPWPVNVFVEGLNDKHALKHLLFRHGVDCDASPRPSHYPEFCLANSGNDDTAQPAASVEGVLSAISDEVAIHAGRTVGFVLDADESPTDRWMAIRDRLAASAVTLLDDASAPVESLATIPAGGFLGTSQKYKTRIGVWLMPNNKDAGALETFLATLVPKSSEGFPAPLYEFAQACTKAAKSNHGAEYRDVDRLKADLACWLAWQENPGRPYGHGSSQVAFETCGRIGVSLQESRFSARRSFRAHRPSAGSASVFGASP